jgi:hypothetical protein
MKLISLFTILLIGLIVVGACVLWWRLASRNSRQADWQSSGPTVESVRRIAELLTLRVFVSDVLTGEGYGYQGVWIIKGDASVGEATLWAINSNCIHGDCERRGVDP